MTARRLLHDDARRGAAGRGVAADLCPHLGRDIAEGLRIGRAGLGHGDRPAFVGGLADRQIERHLTEEIGAEPLGFAAGAAMRKDVAALVDVESNSLLDVTRTVLGSAAGYSATDTFGAIHRLHRLRRNAEAIFAGIDALVVPTAAASLDMAVEDHATNAPESVRRTDEALDALEDILAIELLIAWGLLADLSRDTLGEGARLILSEVDQVFARLPKDAQSSDLHAAVRLALREQLLPAIRAAIPNPT